jgi:hypothetical protein
MAELTRIHTPEALRALASGPTQACQCSLQRCAGWETFPDADWPKAQMQGVATLRNPDVVEPTFEEYHPNGTRYESPNAPVSIAHFPTNRCEVHACQRCGQHVLRYTEYGGYYVDPRARRLNPDLIVP